MLQREPQVEMDIQVQGRCFWEGGVVQDKEVLGSSKCLRTGGGGKELFRAAAGQAEGCRRAAGGGLARVDFPREVLETGVTPLPVTSCVTLSCDP